MMLRIKSTFKELGDIMWYVAQAALALELRLDEVIYTNTLKLAARYPNQMFEVGYSENRAPKVTSNGQHILEW